MDPENPYEYEDPFQYSFIDPEGMGGELGGFDLDSSLGLGDLTGLSSGADYAPFGGFSDPNGYGTDPIQTGSLAGENYAPFGGGEAAPVSTGPDPYTDLMPGEDFIQREMQRYGISREQAINLGMWINFGDQNPNDLFDRSDPSANRPLDYGLNTRPPAGSDSWGLYSYIAGGAAPSWLDELNQTLGGAGMQTWDDARERQKYGPPTPPPAASASWPPSSRDDWALGQPAIVPEAGPAWPPSSRDDWYAPAAPPVPPIIDAPTPLPGVANVPGRGSGNVGFSQAPRPAPLPSRQYRSANAAVASRAPSLISYLGRNMRNDLFYASPFGGTSYEWDNAFNRPFQQAYRQQRAPASGVRGTVLPGQMNRQVDLGNSRTTSMRAEASSVLGAARNSNRYQPSFYQPRQVTRPRSSRPMGRGIRAMPGI
jgi:hypothetical protein